jgi:hypothetical protein
LLADVRAILATTEISDDRQTSRVESALSEESRLWQVRRPDAMCDGVVSEAARYREDRLKKALAITDLCGRRRSIRGSAIREAKSNALANPPQSGSLDLAFCSLPISGCCGGASEESDEGAGGDRRSCSWRRLAAPSAGTNVGRLWMRRGLCNLRRADYRRPAGI